MQERSYLHIGKVRKNEISFLEIRNRLVEEIDIKLNSVRLDTKKRGLTMEIIV